MTITFAAGWIIVGDSPRTWSGRWPPGRPTRDLPNLTRGAGSGWKSCCKPGFKGPVAARVHDLVAIIAYDLDQFRQMIVTPVYPQPRIWLSSRRQNC